MVRALTANSSGLDLHCSAHMMLRTRWCWLAALAAVLGSIPNNVVNLDFLTFNDDL